MYRFFVRLGIVILTALGIVTVGAVSLREPARRDDHHGHPDARRPDGGPVRARARSGLGPSAARGQGVPRRSARDRLPPLGWLDRRRPQQRSRASCSRRSIVAMPSPASTTCSPRPLRMVGRRLRSPERSTTSSVPFASSRRTRPPGTSTRGASCSWEGRRAATSPRSSARRQGSSNRRISRRRRRRGETRRSARSSTSSARPIS